MDKSALWEALSAEIDDEADAVRTVFASSYRALRTAAKFCPRCRGHVYDTNTLLRRLRVR
jgi:hypothetical protein